MSEGGWVLSLTQQRWLIILNLDTDFVTVQVIVPGDHEILSRTEYEGLNK